MRAHALAFLHLALVLGAVRADVLPYSFEAYNALLDYRHARVHALDHVAIDILGEVFMRHEVNDRLGLCLLHNHFHVLPGETMVEVVYNHSSTTEPRLMDWQLATGRVAKDIVPAMLGLTSFDRRPHTL